MPETMRPDEATKTVRDCVCSDCWGPLTAHYDSATRTSSVECSTEGCPNHGFVSRRWVERQEATASMDAINARSALTAAGWLPKKSETDIMKELGF